MSRKNKTLFNSICIGSLLTAAAVLPAVERPAFVSAEESGEEPVGSISISPKLDIPEKEELINQEVNKEDVEKTMNLEAIQLAKKEALAEIDSGIEILLGYKESDLSAMQVKLYRESVAQYSKLVTKSGEKASKDSQVFDVLDEFSSWTKEYKEAITKAKEEEKAEAKEKARLLAQLKKEKSEQDKAGKEITGVVNVTDTSSTPKIGQVSYGIPNLQDQYLTYEPYTAITAKTTPHYRLQTLAKTDKDGYRIYDGAISVALASAYGTTIGTLYEITFSDGKVMRAVLGDNKADIHTDSKHQYRDASEVYDGKSGNIVEIIFDKTNYPDMRSINKKINSDFTGKVVSIVKIGMAEGFE